MDSVTRCFIHYLFVVVQAMPVTVWKSKLVQALQRSPAVQRGQTGNLIHDIIQLLLTDVLK